MAPPVTHPVICIPDVIHSLLGVIFGEVDAKLIIGAGVATPGCCDLLHGGPSPGTLDLGLRSPACPTSAMKLLDIGGIERR